MIDDNYYNSYNNSYAYGIELSSLISGYGNGFTTKCAPNVEW